MLFSTRPNAPFHACHAANRCCSFPSASSADYSGSRWQPSMPLPPQLRRGVSCICTGSEGPSEALGRSAFTVIGSCRSLARVDARLLVQWDVLHIPFSRRFDAKPATERDNSLLHSARQLLPLGSDCRGLSSPPSQTWLCYLPPLVLPSLPDCRVARYLLWRRALRGQWMRGRLSKLDLRRRRCSGLALRDGHGARGGRPRCGT
jgi:hypothetical protein